MGGIEPNLFRNWDPYMRVRQVMASAVIFKNHGWAQWQVGHAKLFGILLWDFETRKRLKFKYSSSLKRYGYMRTHNYRLLNTLVENNLLQREGNGYYSFSLEELDLIKRVVMLIRELDVVGREIVVGVEEKSESTAL